MNSFANDTISPSDTELLHMCAFYQPDEPCINFTKLNRRAALMFDRKTFITHNNTLTMLTYHSNIVLDYVKINFDAIPFSTNGHGQIETAINL